MNNRAPIFTMATVISAMFLLWSPFTESAEQCPQSWPLWQAFSKDHIQADGRVVDNYIDDFSTSEGQSYSLFFALVAGDRQSFDRILSWITSNLAKGDLTANLPAWKWGRDSVGTSRVLDQNSASDADIWIAYSLFQASILWKDQKYYGIAKGVLKNIAQHEITDLPGLGVMLLPAPYGFSIDAETWRLNPSYAPIQLMRYFAHVDRQGEWGELSKNTYQMISETSHRGVVADWVLYRTRKGFQLDSERGKFSGYDAIRVYLWWAMLNQQDPLFNGLKPYVSGSPQFIPSKINVPELISLSDGTVKGKAPIGFIAALAPYRFVVYGHRDRHKIDLSKDIGYYNYVLSLFGYGWMEKRFRFNLDGSLQLKSKSCLN